jgi:hypothetical protein
LNLSFSSSEQTIITYKINSGSLLQITNINYIFTLLNGTDIINKIEDTKLNEDKYNYVHSLLLKTNQIINDNLELDPVNMQLRDAAITLNNTIDQSNILIDSIFIINSDVVFTAIITSLYNSIIHGLNGLPGNNDLNNLLRVVNSFNSPLIILNLLSNIQLYVDTNLPDSDLLPIVTGGIQEINNILETPDMLIPDSKIITKIVNNIVATINNASANNPTNSNLFIVKKMLENYGLPIKVQNVIEYYDKSESNKQNYNIFMVVLLIIFIIYIAKYKE